MEAYSAEYTFARGKYNFIMGLLVLHSFQTFDVSAVPSPSYYGIAKLLTDKLDGYDTRLRPRFNQLDTVVVNVSFVPTSIVKFDTSCQSMLTSGHFTVTWMDEMITWDEGAHLETKTIQLSLQDIWYPQLVLRKSVGSSIIGNFTMDTVQISSSGQVQWKPSGIYGFQCSVDVSAFPFDTQTCTMEFYITDTTIDAAKLQLTHVHTEEYKPNAEWDLTVLKADVEEQHDTNVGKVVFTICRRSKFIIITLILPLSTLTLVNIVAILVPVESEEKNGLAILIFLAYAFYNMVIREALPHNSTQVSYYVIILCVNLFLSALTVIYSIVQTYIYGTRGNQICNVFKKARFGKKKIGVSRGEIHERDIHLKNCEEITWCVFLKRMDTVMFVLTSLFMTMLSVLMYLKIRNNA